MRHIITLLVTFAMSAAASAQWMDTIAVKAETSVSVASNERLNPMWLYSQQWGKYTQYKQAEGLVYAKAEAGVVKTKYFELNAGLGIIGKTEVRRSMIHEAYIDGKIFAFDYLVGMKAETHVAEYDRLTSGNYLMSTNARPTPKIGAGLFDYWSIPGTREWLQVKGAIYFGRLLNENYDTKYTKTHTKDVYTHEKYAYARLGGWYAKPYLGIVHSAFMGGTTPKGVKVPVDVWSTMVAKGSDKFKGSLRGEATNAAGAHQGLWDLGIDISTDALDATMYCKRPFTDYSGLHYFSDRNKDYFAGAVVTFKNTAHLRTISVEYAHTDFQGGDGNPDPAGYDAHGEFMILFPGDLPTTKAGLQKWFYDHFGEEAIEKWAKGYGRAPYESRGMAYEYFRDVWNHNYQYSGRESYAENGFYMQGWTADGLSTGNALFHTRQTADAYSDGYKWLHQTAFRNVRVKALTIAAECDITSRLECLAKVTISRNHGNLLDKYAGGVWKWDLDENYYFYRHKNEIYSMLEMQYAYNSHMKIKGTLAGDFGDMYHSVGMRVGMVYEW